MKDIATDVTSIDYRPEPVSSLIALAAEHSVISLIEGLAAIAEYESEENACCVECQEKALWLHGQLCRLIADYDMQFPVSKVFVTHGGSDLVQ